MRQGTYQGIGYPEDDELDYETNVEQVWREKFAEYLDEDGNVKDPIMEQYLHHQKSSIKASYRIRAWLEESPLTFLLSYFVIKPGAMLVKTFYWQELFGVSELLLDVLRVVNFALCCVTVLLCFVKKRFRMEIGFLTLVYWAYIYMIAMTYSFSRYGETLMSLRYVIGAVGLLLLTEWWKQRKQAKKNI